MPLPFPVVPVDISWSSALVGYCVRGLAARYPFISAGGYRQERDGPPALAAEPRHGENRVLYNASHHANEWICTPVLMKFAEELCQAYVTDGTLFDQSAADILSYADIHLIPAVNPDGMDLVTGELQNGEFYRQAQNIAADYPRFPFPSGWKANIRGVDLNLQYPAYWEQARENKYASASARPPRQTMSVAPRSQRPRAAQCMIIPCPSPRR